ncbi:hypothetical protein MC118_003857 [Salmonella enterica]|nr:hypothetical protein [Salmonella enterica]
MKSNLKTFVAAALTITALGACNTYAATTTTVYADNTAGQGQAFVTGHTSNIVVGAPSAPLAIRDLNQVAPAELLGSTTVNRIVLAATMLPIAGHVYVLSNVDYAGANSAHLNTGFSKEINTVDNSANQRVVGGDDGATVYIVTTQKDGTLVAGNTTLTYTVSDYAS